MKYNIDTLENYKIINKTISYTLLTLIVPALLIFIPSLTKLFILAFSLVEYIWRYLEGGSMMGS